MDRCVDCDREGCGFAEVDAKWKAFTEGDATSLLQEWDAALADCEAHRVNWREQALSWRTVTGFPDAESYRLHTVAQQAEREAIEARMLAAETRIAAATERATALSRAGLGTTEPWAQAGQVLREIAGQMLACLRGEDVPPAVLIPAEAWVPVTERLPEESAVVLVCDRGDVMEGWTWIDCDGDVRWRACSRDLHNVTHWRPMPAPPVVSKTERSDGNA